MAIGSKAKFYRDWEKSREEAKLLKTQREVLIKKLQEELTTARRHTRKLLERLNAANKRIKEQTDEIRDLKYENSLPH